MISLDYLLGVIKEDEDIRANCHSLPAKMIDKHEDEENEYYEFFHNEQEDYFILPKKRTIGTIISEFLNSSVGQRSEIISRKHNRLEFIYKNSRVLVKQDKPCGEVFQRITLPSGIVSEGYVWAEDVILDKLMRYELSLDTEVDRTIGVRYDRL